MRPIFIGLILSSSSPALANGYKDTIEQCLAAHQSGDNSKVRLIASEIKAIKMYGDQTRIDAAKCMSHAYGGKWVYDHSAKAMIKKDTVVAELSDEKTSKDKDYRQKRREKLAQLKVSNGCLKCDLSEANLENADLSGMYFFSTDLSKANLKGANLKGANLNYSILNGANLENANLENARLVGSNLENIYLCGANIKGIKGITPDIIQSIENMTRICTQVKESNGDYVDNEVEDLRKKIEAALVDQSYMSSKNKALLLNEIYNTIRHDKYLISMLKIDLTNLFTKYLELPFYKVSDFLNTSFDGMPLNEAAINKLILSLPNSSILTFRYLIQDNKQFTIDARQRRKVIKDIDQIILEKINISIIAYGSEKDAEGSPKAVKIFYLPLTVATNIDTDIKFEGRFSVPAGIKPNEFNELFSWSYNNKKAKTVVIGREIKWIKPYKIQQINAQRVVFHKIL